MRGLNNAAEKRGGKKKGCEGQGRAGEAKTLFVTKPALATRLSTHACARACLEKKEKKRNENKGFRKYFCILQISKWKKLHFFSRLKKNSIFFIFFFVKIITFSDKMWNNLKAKTKREDDTRRDERC